MRYKVQLHEVSSQPLAAAYGQVDAQNIVPQLFVLLDEVWKFLHSNPQVNNRGLNVFLYYGDDNTNLLNTDHCLPIAAGVIVTDPFESSGKVVYSATPSGTVATVTHIGPYEKLAEAHSAVRKWCEENNRPIVGMNWEIYDHPAEDPGNLRTDVFYLLKD